MDRNVKLYLDVLYLSRPMWDLAHLRWVGHPTWANSHDRSEISAHLRWADNPTWANGHDPSEISAHLR